MKSNDVDDTLNSTFQDRLRDFAHELGTPLNAMIGYSHLIKVELEGECDVAKLKEYNQTIESSTMRLLRICERVLDDAVSGEQSVTITNVDMKGVAEGVVSTFRELAKQRGIELKIDFPMNFPSLATDQVMIEQVLSNLVSNAIKFTPTGGSIGIKGEISIKNKAMVFVVRDTGKGIPAALLLQIRKGERVISTAKQHGNKGWGRGLSIATEICRKLNATLVFEPTDTGGTVVMFSLPIADI